MYWDWMIELIGHFYIINKLRDTKNFNWKKKIDM